MSCYTVKITESTIFKVGDILIAHRSHNSGSDSDAFTKGKEYRIQEVVNNMVIFRPNSGFYDDKYRVLTYDWSNAKCWFHLKQREFNSPLDKDIYETETMGYPYK